MEENKEIKYPIEFIKKSIFSFNIIETIFVVFVFIACLILFVWMLISEPINIKDALSTYIAIIFIVFCLFMIFRGVINYRTYTIDSQNIKVKYKFLKSKDIEKKLEDCIGYGIFYLHPYGKGVLLKFREGEFLTIDTQEGKKINYLIDLLQKRNIIEVEDIGWLWWSTDEVKKLLNKKLEAKL